MGGKSLSIPPKEKSCHQAAPNGLDCPAMLKKAAIVLPLMIAAICGFIALRPSDFRVTRSTLIAAPASQVFARVNDFHQWEEWSPWADADPHARLEYAGAPSGVGAVFRWAGNARVGEGSMTITESRPPEAIRIALDFVKPAPGRSDVDFIFQPEADGTRVTWSMSGKNNFMAKAFALLVDCDKIVGGDFEKGLATLKRVSEAPKP